MSSSFKSRSHRINWLAAFAPCSTAGARTASEARSHVDTPALRIGHVLAQVDRLTDRCKHCATQQHQGSGMRIPRIIDISLELDARNFHMRTPAGFKRDMQFEV